jgi:hypothetical protein
MEGFYLDTIESEFELVGYMRPTKAPWKDKNLKYIVDSVHLSFMAASYNHHYMLYSWNKSNVTQFVPSQVWKTMYKHY